MMRASWICVPVLLLAGACGGSGEAAKDSPEASAAPQAATASAAPSGGSDGELVPGLWRSSMEVTEFVIPGAPAEVAGAMRSAMASAEPMDSCMTAEQARAGVKEHSGRMQRGTCQMADYTQSGGKMSGTLTCGGTGLAGGVLKMEGTYEPTKVAMTVSSEVTDSNIPGGKVKIGMTITSERVGDCPAQ